VPVYAAYASNMDPARMAQRCPHSPLRGTGWLNGWRLTFAGEQHGWDGALATVVGAHGSQVFVTLYDLTNEDEAKLDEWEPSIYTKLRLRVDTLDGDVLAWLYVLNDYEGGLPSASYLGILVEAAAAAGAPEDYVEELRRRECRSISE
jgi:gamma-glutamylcyclotransferase (GGCT)/AIG2-like uncharacterized protein YtfP